MLDPIRRAEDVVSTPEGDNEFAPDQPLAPDAVESGVEGLQPWPSNSAMEQDRKSPAPETHHEHHTGLREIIDEISTGKILP